VIFHGLLYPRVDGFAIADVEVSAGMPIEAVLLETFDSLVQSNFIAVREGHNGTTRSEELGRNKTNAAGAASDRNLCSRL
jgi:hypothetical protein